MKNLHIPIMTKEVINNLITKKNGIYIDGTFGGGGHSIEILKNINNNGKLLIFDNDYNSIKIAKKIIDNRININHLSFTSIKNFLIKNKLVGKIDGILLDLGISTNQINDYKRGFSFNKNGILDMRVNIKEGIPAYEWLKKSSAKEIKKVFNLYGNEYKYSDKISKEIYNFNKKNTLKRSEDLVKIILNFHKSKNKIHPATKYFQAIRIYINNEINNIKKILLDSYDILNNNGKLLIISFNSLENLVINKFNKKNTDIINIPIKYNEENLFFKKNKFLKKIKKIKPSKDEIYNNKKSRNSILNIFKKIN